MALALLVALPTGATLGRATDAMANEPCTTAWQRVSTPFDAVRGALLDADRGADGTRMAIGGGGTIGSPVQRTLSMVARGEHWREVPIPAVSRHDVLFALSVRSRQDAWAVGHVFAGSYRALTVHWNGRRWSPVQTPLTSAEALLTDVGTFGPTGAIAVGYLVGNRGPRPMAMRWTQGEWHLENMPARKDADASLTTVEVVNANDIWAGGWINTNGFNRPYLAHWDGTAWTPARVAGLPKGEVVLTDITMRGPATGWAVGYWLIRGSLRPITMAWDGATWRVTSSPDGAGPVTLVRAADSTADQLTIVGTEWRNSRYRSVIFVHRGGAWSRVASGAKGSELYAVDARGPRALAVGADLPYPLLLRRCDTSEGSGTHGDIDATTPSPFSPRWLESDEDRPPVLRHDLREAPRLPHPEALAGIVFRDIARDVGLDAWTTSYGVVPADFDGDGWVDVFLSAHGHPAQLWLNTQQGGKRVFAHVSRRFAYADRHGCAAGDVDGNGTAELACAVGASRGQSVKAGELWFDVGGEPTNRTIDLGVVDPLGRGRRTLFLDADDDGRLDLFVTNDSNRVDGLPSQNRLYLNRWPKQFVPSPAPGINKAAAGGCLVASDLDQDGRQELLVCERHAGEDGLRVYRNLGSRFTDVTSRWGIAPIGDQAVAVGDFDGDGLPDLVQVSADRVRVSQNVGQQFVVRWEASLRNGAAVAAADITKDGLADLYIVQGGPRPRKDVLLVARPGWVFQSVRIPQARAGSGEAVATLDYNDDGRWEFLVTNGHDASGPVELIAGFPRPASITRTRP
jgi:hypothetical protein